MRPVRASASRGGEIGSVVFDSESEPMQEEYGVEDRVDFTLIQLDTGVNELAHPQAISMDGSTGFIDCSDTARGDWFSFHGIGVPWGAFEETRTRRGIVTTCDGRDYAGQANVSGGDSGGPVIHDASGAALGIMSRVGYTLTPPAILTGPTLPYVFTELAKAGFGRIALATADGAYVGPGSRANERSEVALAPSRSK